MAAQPTVLLFGPGAVGSTYIHILTQAGCAVTAIARSNYAAISQHGIQLDSDVFGRHTIRPAHVARSVQDAVDELQSRQQPPSHFDFVVLCSKATVPSAAPLLVPAIGPHTTIVLCQNGIEIEADYAARYPANPLLSCVVYLPVTQTSPGHVRHLSMELLEIGTYPALSPPQRDAKQRAEEFARLFGKGAGTAKLYEDVQEARWRKLLLNAPWNPVCALAMLDDARFLDSSDEAVELIREIMREVAGVAHAAGYTEIGEAAIEEQLGRALQRKEAGKGIEPSMLADVRRGAPLEVEVIVGNTVRVARRLGVKCRVLEVVYVLARARDVALRLGME